MEKDIVISNQEKLEEAKKKISEGGASSLHVLSDFDRTLTTALVDGENVPSIMSILRDGNYLTPDYAAKAHELFNKFHTIEIDNSLSREEKKRYMLEWWTVHFDLIIKSGLTKEDVENIVERGKIRFRKGFSEFVDFLKDNNIPLVILSSSGLGGDAISMCLEKEGKLYSNIHIISNNFIWDDSGKAVGVKQPVIHSLNKDETAINNIPGLEAVRNRRNILLLGDGLDDVDMLVGTDYEALIKIGFLNEKIEERLEDYKKIYDVVLLNDAPMDYINNLLKEIVE